MEPARSSVWFDGGAGYPLPGEVLGFLGVKSTQLQIRNVLDEQIFIVETDSPSIRPRNRDEDGMANMINLRVLHEGSVILNLKRRFEEHQIYTYIGSILVALNPYKPCDIYGVDVVKEYQKAMIGDNLPPHLFAVANTAFLKMVRTSKNQTVVISGVITGAKTTDYLLEKSRIVSQAPYERNYHIFYEMLAGMTEADKNKYGLQQAQSYYYLNQEAHGEKIYSSYSVEQALEARDAIAKSLYQRLFVWLVERVNRTVYRQSERRCRTIGILDIFGFEDFDVNSFEQLCINFANEKLHDHFNRHIFKLEQ
ncbi:PREDICTED: unconventional myosin-VIIa-like, partial [Branchiostoma belcheri]|uniref:Unconventional myosin-VIIa-like n=1 Tax=Branchiostoma belcheri TaxID=7741 RepID=A0A6P4ZGP8_BRABE